MTYDPKYCAEPPPIVEPLPLFPFDKTAFTEQTTTAATTLLPFGLTGLTVFPFITTSQPTIPTMPTFSLPTFTPIVEPVSSSSTLFTPPWFPFIMGGISSSTALPITAPTLPIIYPFVTPKPIVIIPESFATTTNPTPVLQSSSMQASIRSVFDLLIMGNRTTPFFDRRRGEIIQESNDLICDFANNFPCLWGPENGKWAVIDRGKKFSQNINF